MAESILVVDDEKEIADLIELYLRNDDYEVFKFYSAGEALESIASREFDLAVLDIMLPDTDGFKLCQKIRERYTYPIIMLTAKNGESDKITGLTLGADDYITKPFMPLELVARIKAQLRRYKKYDRASAGDMGDGMITRSNLVMNVKTHECFINERPLALTPTEFQILRILLEQNGNVVSSEELFRKIWKDEYYVKSNNTITVHIRHLREKIGKIAGNSDIIKTVWGVGYKIEKQQ